MPKINQLLHKAQTKLLKHKLRPEEAAIILSKITNKTPEYIYSHQKKILSWWSFLVFKFYIWLRTKHYPLAYILGYKEFYGYKFKVNKNVLIPRPESELIIDELKIINPDNKTIIDIGTGSGCLIITAAKELKQNNHFYGLDISMPALTIAKKNNKYLKTKVNFFHGYLLKPIIKKEIKPEIVIANLPYLTKQQLKEPTIKYEPKKALYSKTFGLMHYFSLLKQLSKYHQPEYLILEINPEQVENLLNKILEYFPDYRIDVKKDLQGIDRLLIAKS